MVELPHPILLSSLNCEECAQDANCPGIQRFLNEPCFDSVLKREAARSGELVRSRQAPLKDAFVTKCYHHVT
ncbi:hypothetical protein Y032_0382g368 [Ancylostoma ceylanicum]|uniref:Uncharacterized protein n=1 Tax=Ancylostoma ceylanicum TaxID=53326 RepID=A0A016RT31_9BILA|nr:hypothetical protein Y032_0382g368 [Ancylostoma ceylanicum]